MTRNQGRVVLITGSAQGIGRGIALRLADDGYDIAINDLERFKKELEELSEIIKSKGRRVFIGVADASVKEEVEGLIDATVENLGGLDVMIANAGVCLVKSFIDTTIEEWDRVFSINLRGAFFAYQYAAKVMIKQERGGRIIGACSGAGKFGCAMMSAYSSSKFALRGMTQSAAAELGKYGITVNAYAPGPIVTPMLDKVGDDFGGKDVVYAAEAQRIPVGHLGTPEDIAALVSYLASKEAKFVTGQTVQVNGGRDFD
ncbi:hypothetical protein D9613_008350 [Agrocybe pediades]|uniref:Uncharacterized protein n=1 Tax=Agrocybe pediades TaxID=84607 RepID=A0A8H4QRX2_9AGAR|nr:hypothetical protein D9613_008350 [Agrocybe pediades]